MSRTGISYIHSLKGFSGQPWKVDKNFVFTDTKPETQKSMKTVKDKSQTSTPGLSELEASIFFHRTCFL